MWFAPGVGLVKWSESWIGGMRVHELTTFGIKDPVDETDSKMDIRGQITSLTGPGDGNQDRGFLGRVMIEGKREPGMSDRAYVNITTSTRILEVVGTERRKVGFDALQTGQNVEARFIGPVLTSYPVQATAGEIVILKE